MSRVTRESAEHGPTAAGSDVADTSKGLLEVSGKPEYGHRFDFPNLGQNLCPVYKDSGRSVNLQYCDRFSVKSIVL